MRSNNRQQWDALSFDRVLESQLSLPLLARLIKSIRAPSKTNSRSYCKTAAWAVSLALHAVAFGVVWHHLTRPGASPALASTPAGGSELPVSLLDKTNADASPPPVSPPDAQPPGHTAISPPIITSSSAIAVMAAPTPPGIRTAAPLSYTGLTGQPQARHGGGGRGPRGGVSGSRQEAFLPPRYMQNPAPDYPPAAQRQRQQGTVLLRVTVSANGRPLEIRVSKSSGSVALDEAAIRGVRKWLFEPARLGERSVVATVEIPVSFRLARGGGS